MFKCSFDELVGEKVVSPSYSSAILGLPSISIFYKRTKIENQERTQGTHFPSQKIYLRDNFGTQDLKLNRFQVSLSSTQIEPIFIVLK